MIETWHGSIGIKKFGKDANKDKDFLRRIEWEGSVTDYIVSCSDFEDGIYSEDFWKDTPIWKFGHPRNDILLCKDIDKIAALKNKIFSWYHIPTDAKLCLYVPTFRDDGDLSPYSIDYNGITDALKQKWGVLDCSHKISFQGEEVYKEGSLQCA